jgi:hypothetical protein
MTTETTATVAVSTAGKAPRKPFQPGPLALRRAVSLVADLMRLQRSLETRLTARRVQAGVLRRQPGLDGVRDELDNEAGELLRLLSANAKALAAAMARSQAIADQQPDQVDIDSMVMTEVQRLTRLLPASVTGRRNR